MCLLLVFLHGEREIENSSMIMKQIRNCSFIHNNQWGIESFLYFVPKYVRTDGEYGYDSFLSFGLKKKKEKQSRWLIYIHDS